MNKEQLDLIKVISRGVSDGIVTATQKLESLSTPEMTMENYANILQGNCGKQTTCETCPFYMGNSTCSINFPYLWKIKNQVGEKGAATV